MWDDPAEDADMISWGHRFRDDLRRFTSGGTWLNFISDADQGRVRAAFGPEKCRRLAEIKRRYDPGNVFRGNQNIGPAE